MNKIKAWVFVGFAATSAFFGLKAAQPSPVVITTVALKVGTINAAYSTQLSATGGRGPYTWSAMVLPPGFSVSGNSIVGSTFQPYTGTVLIVVRDKNNRTASKSLPLAVCYPFLVVPFSASVGANGMQQYTAWGGAQSLNPPICAGPPPISF